MAVAAVAVNEVMAVAAMADVAVAVDAVAVVVDAVAVALAVVAVASHPTSHAQL